MLTLCVCVCVTVLYYTNRYRIHKGYYLCADTLSQLVCTRDVLAHNYSTFIIFTFLACVEMNKVTARNDFT